MERTTDEVSDARAEYSDRLWYYRHTANPSSLPQAVEAAENIRERYPDVQGAEQLSPYDLGLISGKLSALNWLLGDDWDFLDT